MVSILFYLLLGLVFCGAILLITPVTIKARYQSGNPPAHADSGSALTLVFLGGLYSTSFKSRRTTAADAAPEAQPDKAAVFQQLRRIREMHRQLAPVRRVLFNCATLHSWRWHTGLGLEEPHYTGLAVGALWALKSSCTAAAYRRARSQKTAPDLMVTPFFNQERIFWTQFNCILTLRLGHIIYAALLLGRLGLKNAVRSGGIDDGTTSHRGIDENSNGKHQGHGGCQHRDRGSGGDAGR